MAIKLMFEKEPGTDKIASIYYELLEDDVHRTVELDTNCLLDLTDTNQPLGLEIVGPFSISKAKESAAIYCCPELDEIFLHLEGERNLVLA